MRICTSVTFGLSSSGRPPDRSPSTASFGFFVAGSSAAASLFQQLATSVPIEILTRQIGMHLQKDFKKTQLGSLMCDNFLFESRTTIFCQLSGGRGG